MGNPAEPQSSIRYLRSIFKMVGLAGLPAAMPVWLALLTVFRSPLHTANRIQTHFVGSHPASLVNG
jgi:hypothetical protein